MEREGGGAEESIGEESVEGQYLHLHLLVAVDRRRDRPRKALRGRMRYVIKFEALHDIILTLISILDNFKTPLIPIGQVIHFLNLLTNMNNSHLIDTRCPVSLILKSFREVGHTF